ncbi:MAG: hypothetical protein IIY53_00850, partial [Solobacterium sp.]|nr:hypothetical protein [Solobacterium sp.]
MALKDLFKKKDTNDATQSASGVTAADIAALGKKKDDKKEEVKPAPAPVKPAATAVKPAATVVKPAVKPAAAPIKPAVTVKPAAPALKAVDDIAKEVIHGDWGNGEERKEKLTAAGYDYATVQAKVNEIMSGKAAPAAGLKALDVVAKEVIRGDWGNGEDRKQKLAAAGYDYAAVQAKVNELMSGAAPAAAPAALKPLEEVAKEVIRGNWG